MSQELVNSVNKLTDETSALLQEYVKGNTVLQNSASDAASSAAAAKASETNSINQANIATQKAAESKQYRDETAAIATGGTATVDPAPGKIPLANSQGKISSGWLTALAFARTKADMDAMRASVNRQCAASGMIHAGKAESVSLGVVNEGMWTALDAAVSNMFLIGRGPNGSKQGQSETEHPVFNMAGFPVHLKGLPHQPGPAVDWVPFAAKFPQAPDGTDIYDSSGNCRGTGKPTLNLLTEVDPKYGDVAPNVNEAVARAFEGLAGNGDGRLPKRTANSSSIGNWHVVGPSYDDSLSIVNNIIRFDVTTSLNSYLRLRVTNGDLSNAPYEVEYEVASISSETPFGYCRFGGVDIPKSVGKHKLTINPTNLADSSLQFGTYTNSQGSFIELKNVSIRPATEEVVTERVDLSGLEGYLEEITPAKPYIYPYGGINNQATSVDGIATTVDNVRPITYFANFTGDTTSRGRGWNLNELTDAELLTILQNPYHHVYVIDGRLVQFRVRPRQIAGAGNGDWAGVQSNEATLRYHANRLVAPRGAKDPVEDYTTSSPYYYGYSSNQFKNVHSTIGQGVFGSANFNGGVGSPDTAVAYNGECYFYVLATVLRLNQGGYHPSLNPLGAARWVNSAANWDSDWSGLGAGFMADVSVNAVKDCFVRKVSGKGGVAYGTISSGKTGRPDGRRYDAIYPDGQGGVIDRRLSAFPVTIDDYFKAMSKAENGSMRGMESLSETAVFDCGVPVGKGQQSTFVHINLPKGTVPSKFFNAYTTDGGSTFVGGHFIDASGVVFTIAKVWGDSGNDYVYLTRAFGLSTASIDITGKCFVVPKRPINLSVSGNFLQTDVIGDPATILQVDALKAGWIGSWIPVMPDGNSKFYELTRKSVISSAGSVSGTRLYTSDLGTTWSGSSLSFTDAALNGYTAGHASDLVVIMNYTAAAKVTKPSSFLSVYGARDSLRYVMATKRYLPDSGVLLAESLLGKVLKDNSTSSRFGHYAITKTWVYENGKLANFGDDLTKHTPIDISAPINNSPAIKILPHAVSDNGQATLGFVWNELKHNGTNWGDDGTVRIIDNTGTYNNLNEQTCLYGYAELALPIGWVDNRARFGTQVPGVDL